jgi:hypothetical protein
MSGTLHWRVTLRDAADTFDAVVLSSHPDDDNPVLMGPPEGDGESLDPLTGQIGLAEYTVEVADASGTIATDDEGTTATARVITGLLADSTGRWDGINRVASIAESDDDGDTWTTVWTGYLVRLSLAGGVHWTLSLSDSDRRERTITAFATAPDQDHFHPIDLLSGEPFFHWAFTVFKTSDTNGDLPTGVVALKTYAPSDLSGDQVQAANDRVRPYAQQDGSGHWTFPGLTAVITGSGLDTTAAPWGAGEFTTDLFKPMAGAGQTPTILGVAQRKYLYLKWTGSLPADGTIVSVAIQVAGAPTDDAAIVFVGHPVDFVTELLTEYGVAFDATSAATVKAAWPTLQVNYRLTALENLWGLLERAVFGPYGFALRRSLTTNEWEFFATRELPPDAPDETIGDTDITEPERVIFDLDIATQITEVLWVTHAAVGRTAEGVGPVPSLVAGDWEVTDIYTAPGGSDVATYGQHQLVYDIPGVVYDAASPSAEGD